MLHQGDCLTFRLDDARFGAAAVLALEVIAGVEWAIVAVTRLALEHPPDSSEIAGAEVLIINYDGLLVLTREIYVLRAGSFRSHADLFVTAGRLPTKRKHDAATFIRAGDGWDGIPDTVNRQLAWEIDCPAPTEHLALAQLL